MTKMDDQILEVLNEVKALLKKLADDEAAHRAAEKRVHERQRKQQEICEQLKAKRDRVVEEIALVVHEKLKPIGSDERDCCWDIADKIVSKSPNYWNIPDGVTPEFDEERVKKIALDDFARGKWRSAKVRKLLTPALEAMVSRNVNTPRKRK